MDRRSFLKGIAGYGAASLAHPAATLLAHDYAAPAYFGLHPFLEAHPEAVFIRKTHVPSRTDAEAKRRESLALAKQIFTLRDTPGVPLTHKFAIKPNLTAAKESGLYHAIVTDPYVVEGFIDGLKGLGIRAENIYMREGLMVSQPGVGYIELAQRSGVHYGDKEARTPTTKDCQEGVVFRRTKYLGPFNCPDSCLINIAKYKTHAMGLTLCVKNLQGSNIQPYIRFCSGIQNAIAGDFQPDAERHVDDLYARHRQAGMPRWENEKAAWMEMWAQRTLDSYSLIQPNVVLNIIEGVYAQDGDGFDGGPGPDGVPEIFPTNLLIFGKDAFRVDIIGHWLAGQEPGNFGLFHIGKERGLSTALNPRNIPVYLWQDGGPRLTPLDKFTRTPLKTPYLGRFGEPHFHLCNEPFAYPSEPAVKALSGGETPGIRVLGRSKSRNAPSSLVIEYNLPADGFAALEVYSITGERIGVPVEGWTSRGVHMAEWSTRKRAPGIYCCRLRLQGAELAKFVTLVG